MEWALLLRCVDNATFDWNSSDMRSVCCKFFFLKFIHLSSWTGFLVFKHAQIGFLDLFVKCLAIFSFGRVNISMKQFILLSKFEIRFDFIFINGHFLLSQKIAQDTLLLIQKIKIMNETIKGLMSNSGIFLFWKVLSYWPSIGLKISRWNSNFYKKNCRTKDFVS